MLRKRLRNSTILMRKARLERSPAVWSVLYVSMINDATMEENKVFCRVIVRDHIWTVNHMRIASHQENHRVSITLYAVDEFLVIDLCLGSVQYPICGGCVAVFRGLNRSESEIEFVFASQAYLWSWEISWEISWEFYDPKKLYGAVAAFVSDSELGIVEQEVASVSGVKQTKIWH
jgi:hypothetical protein